MYIRMEYLSNRDIESGVVGTCASLGRISVVGINELYLQLLICDCLLTVTLTCVLINHELH